MQFQVTRRDQRAMQGVRPNFDPGPDLEPEQMRTFCQRSVATVVCEPEPVPLALGLAFMQKIQQRLAQDGRGVFDGLHRRPDITFVDWTMINKKG